MNNKANECVTLQTIQMLTAEERARVVSKNPVGAALCFERMINVTLKHLLGIDLDSVTKTTIPLCLRRKGVLSVITAYFGVFETQGRGTLHAHINFWGSLSPNLLQKCSEFDELVKEIGDVLDSMVTAELSKNAYEAMAIRRKATSENRDAKYYPSLYECPTFTYEEDSPFIMCYEAAASSVQVHAHTFTCRKGPLGQCYCRMAYPQAIHEGRTGPTELVPYSIPGSTVDLSYKDIQVRPLD
jgi:hypothetical protein